jgi:hypothetical protein
MINTDFLLCFIISQKTSAKQPNYRHQATLIWWLITFYIVFLIGSFFFCLERVRVWQFGSRILSFFVFFFFCCCFIIVIFLLFLSIVIFISFIHNSNTTFFVFVEVNIFPPCLFFLFLLLFF